VGFSATKEENSLRFGMPGWRRSADRTRLQMNSLQTGNFTGNFAIFGPRGGLESKKLLH
jgi:hypothetical protein